MSLNPSKLSTLGDKIDERAEAKPVKKEKKEVEKVEVKKKK